MKRLSKKQLGYWIGKIGYDILDNIVGPACGASNILADLYLVDVATYAIEEELCEKIVKKIVRKYKIGGYLVTEVTPIALIALIILEEGKY